MRSTQELGARLVLWRTDGATEAAEGSAERQGVAPTAVAASERGSAAPKEEAAAGVGVAGERVGINSLLFGLPCVRLTAEQDRICTIQGVEQLTCV